MIVAGVWNFKDVGSLISWFLIINDCSRESETLRGEDTVMLHTLTNPPVVLGWQGRWSSSHMELYYMHTVFCPARTMQGDRCDLTRQWPNRSRRCHSDWDQKWISDSLLPQGENTSSSSCWSAPHHCQGRTALRHDTKTHHVISQDKLQF